MGSKVKFYPQCYTDLVLERTLGALLDTLEETLAFAVRQFKGQLVRPQPPAPGEQKNSDVGECPESNAWIGVTP